MLPRSVAGDGLLPQRLVTINDHSGSREVSCVVTGKVDGQRAQIFGMDLSDQILFRDEFSIE